MRFSTSFRHLCLWVLAATFVATSSACAFFEEIPLEGEESTSTSTDATNTSDAGACKPADNRCDGQDKHLRCEGDPVALKTYNCADVCLTNTNVACIRTSAELYGCWCVAPNALDLTNCTGLEYCLETCGNQIFGECGQHCFARADASTSRLLGSLLNCAQTDCRDICLSSPDADCNECVRSRMQGESGACTQLRALCDQDRTPDEVQ